MGAWSSVFERTWQSKYLLVLFCPKLFRLLRTGSVLSSLGLQKRILDHSLESSCWFKQSFWCSSPPTNSDGKMFAKNFLKRKKRWLLNVAHSLREKRMSQSTFLSQSQQFRYLQKAGSGLDSKNLTIWLVLAKKPSFDFNSWCSSI